MGEYIYIEGEEFYTWQNEGLSKEKVSELKEDELHKNANPAYTFPLKVVVRKRKDGYYCFSNDTCHNYDEFERSGIIPADTSGIRKRYKDGR